MLLEVYIYIHIFFFFSISLLNFCKDSVNLSVKVSLKLNLLIFKNNFIYLFMAVLSLHCCVGFSFSCTEQGTTLILHCSGFSYFGAQAPGSQASAVAFWHMGSSLIRDGNHVSSINRQILYHWATREAPKNKSINLKALDLMVHQLRLQISIARGTGSAPGWGTKILHVTQQCQKLKKFIH